MSAKLETKFKVSFTATWELELDMVDWGKDLTPEDCVSEIAFDIADLNSKVTVFDYRPDDKTGVVAEVTLAAPVSVAPVPVEPSKSDFIASFLVLTKLGFNLDQFAGCTTPDECIMQLRDNSQLPTFENAIWYGERYRHAKNTTQNISLVNTDID